MKTIVSVQEISEFDLKPSEAVLEWRALVREEIRRRWKNKSNWIDVEWPIGDPTLEKPAFECEDFFYVESRACGSLYAPHRPSEDEIWFWYRESIPSKFWRNNLLVSSRISRQEKINEPRSDWIVDGISEYRPLAISLLDVSTNSRDLIDLVASKNIGLKNIVIAGMTGDLEGESTSTISVMPTKIGNLADLGMFDVIIASDILDRVADLRVFIDSLEKILAPGGVAFITCPVSSGFEVQTLWDLSPSVLPPDKLNIPSIKGLQLLFQPEKWEILELSTPGMFDVDLVRRIMSENPNRTWPRIVKSLVESADENGRLALMELLQSQRLSSFARLVIKRKK